MKSIKPFQPRQGLKPTLRNISALNGADADIFSDTGDSELTFRADSQAAVGDILLLLIDALEQFRLQRSAGVSVSNNTTVIKNNICGIVNNYRSVISAYSPTLKQVTENIGVLFSGDGSQPRAITESELERCITELRGALGSYSKKTVRHTANVEEASNFIAGRNIGIKSLFTKKKTLM